MRYICIRTYGRGVWQNKIFPVVFRHIDSASKQCDILNSRESDTEPDEKWVIFPLYEED